MSQEDHIQNVVNLLDKLEFKPINLYSSSSFLFVNTDSRLGDIFGVTQTLSDISPVLSDEFEEQ